MIGKKSKQNKDLEGTTTTFDEKGKPIPESEATETSTRSLSVKVNRRGATVTEDNPFLHQVVQSMQLKTKLRTVKRGTAVIENSATGEKIDAFTTVEQSESIDSKRFIKVFSGPEYRDVYNLTMPGLKMYLVVLDVLGDVSSMNKVHIRLTTAMATRLTGRSEKPLSEATVNRGIKDLIDKGYLAGAEINGETEGWYWINPQRFFNGDTVVVKKIYRLARENKTSQLEVKLPKIPAETVLRAMTRDLFEDDNGDDPEGQS